MSQGNTDGIAQQVANFDPFSTTYAQESVEVNRRLRECPVARSSQYGGFWSIARYEDVLEAFKRDGKELSARHEIAEGDTELHGVTLPSMPIHLGFMEQDPPFYTPIRRALNPWFSAQACAERRPRIEELASALLDSRIETGRVDMLDDLIRPLAAISTLEHLGLALESVETIALPIQDPDRETYSATDDASDVSMETLGPDAVYVQVQAVLKSELSDRRSLNHDRGDVIDVLRNLRVDDVPLDDQFVAESILLLIVGGVETVGGAFGGAIHYLDGHHEDRQHLIDEPQILRTTAFDEFLRFITPTTQNARTALCDFELAGQQIRRGDVLYLNLLSANHDEQRFPDPEKVVLDRRPNGHMALGVGIHHCVGGHLARVMWSAMMEQVLQRIPDYRIEHDQAHRVPTLGVNNGFEHLPATFTPGPRRSSSDLIRRDLARALPHRDWLL